MMKTSIEPVSAAQKFTDTVMQNNEQIRVLINDTTNLVHQMLYRMFGDQEVICEDVDTGTIKAVRSQSDTIIEAQGSAISRLQSLFYDVGRLNDQL